MTVFQFLLDPVTKRLNFERFSRLGFLVGLSEDDILETCLVFGFRKSAMEMMGQEVRRFFPTCITFLSSNLHSNLISHSP